MRTRTDQDPDQGMVDWEHVVRLSRVRIDRSPAAAIAVRHDNQRWFTSRTTDRQSVVIGYRRYIDAGRDRGWGMLRQ